jgi:hypothetical protein
VDDDAERDLDIPFCIARMSPSVRNVAPVLLGGGIVVSPRRPQRGRSGYCYLAIFGWCGLVSLSRHC